MPYYRSSRTRETSAIGSLERTREAPPQDESGRLLWLTASARNQAPCDPPRRLDDTDSHRMSALGSLRRNSFLLRWSAPSFWYQEEPFKNPFAITMLPSRLGVRGATL